MEDVKKYKADIMAYLKTKENEAGIIDVLNKLQSVPMTIGILSETKLGIALAKLKKEGTETIAKLSSDLIAQWKSLVTSSASTSDDKPTPPDLKRKREDEEADGKDVKRRANDNDNVVKLNSSGTVVKSEVKTEDKTPVKSEPTKTEPVKTEVAKSEPVKSEKNGANNSSKYEVLTTTDPARIAAIKKFVDALKKQQTDSALLEAAERVAAEIEEELFFMYKGITKEYKDKFRTLWFNINDGKNQQLRDKLLMTEVSAHILCNMSNAELANPDLQKEMQAIHKENEKKNLRGVKEATCTQFTCSKCKQNKTTYFQMQTRSADEPMTTFVECINCGNRWKFC
jgi:transcription elongation factor S-II